MTDIKARAIALLRATILDLERDDFGAAVAHHASADVALAALADELTAWSEQDRDDFADHFTNQENKPHANR